MNTNQFDINIKQKLVGNSLGRTALSFRDKIQILRTASADPERVGTLANDQLATKLITTLCEPHKTFIDVGAHVGSIISEVLNHEPSVRIVAIEAIPEKMVPLRRTFPTIEFHSCAVGDSTDEVSFYVDYRPNRSGYSSLGRLDDTFEGPTAEIKVPLRRLDDLVTYNDIDAIKIDVVEGAELGVLRGSPNILSRSRPTIMFESGPQINDGLGYTKEDLYQFLNSHEYSVLIPNRVAHEDSGLSQDGFIDSHKYPQRTINYFAIPKERRSEIRDKARKNLNLARFTGT